MFILVAKKFYLIDGLKFRKLSHRFPIVYFVFTCKHEFIKPRFKLPPLEVYRLLDNLKLLTYLVPK